MVLLTIAVPSFSDKSMLERTLENLANIPKEVDLEVLVSDNRSNDGSYALAESLASTFDVPYRAFQQETNKGFLGNVTYLANSAKGKYIWVVGIGETIVIPHLLDLLDELGNQDYLFGTVGSFMGDATKFSVSSDFCFRKSDGRMTLPVYSETISLNVFQTSLLRDAIMGGFKTGNWWPHIEVLMQSLQSDPNGVYFHSPTEIVGIAENHDGWWFDKPNALEGVWAQISIINEETYPLIKNSTWLKKRRRYLRLRWVGATILKMRQNKFKIESPRLRHDIKTAHFTFGERFLVFLAFRTPLSVFYLMRPIARIVGL